MCKKLPNAPKPLHLLIFRNLEKQHMHHLAFSDKNANLQRYIFYTVRLTIIYNTFGSHCVKVCIILKKTTSTIIYINLYIGKTSIKEYLPFVFDCLTDCLFFAHLVADNTFSECILYVVVSVILSTARQSRTPTATARRTWRGGPRTTPTRSDRRRSRTLCRETWTENRGCGGDGCAARWRCCCRWRSKRRRTCGCREPGGDAEMMRPRARWSEITLWGLVRRLPPRPPPPGLGLETRLTLAWPALLVSSPSFYCWFLPSPPSKASLLCAKTGEGKCGEDCCVAVEPSCLLFLAE